MQINFVGRQGAPIEIAGVAEPAGCGGTTFILW
jgi:hypothetical protein